VLLHYLFQKKILSSPRLAFYPCRNDLPKLYFADLRAIWDTSRTDGNKVRLSGLAHSMDLERAISKSIGEMLERYFLSLYKNDSLLRSSYQDLLEKGTAALNIFELNSFLPWQERRNPRFAKTSESPFYWVEGETMDRRVTYLPAQLVFWNYNLACDLNEPVLGHPTTNGAAGHFTRDGAILAGLLENIQRDGFLIYWLNGISPKRIDASLIDDDETQSMLSDAERYGLKMHFLNTTSDIGVPSIMCAIVDPRTNEPVIAVGGGTGFNLKDTILHGAYEALSVLNHAEQYEGFTISEKYEPFIDPTIGHLERIRLWRGKKMLERLSFFINGPLQTPDEFIGSSSTLDTFQKQLPYVLDTLRSMGIGYEPYVYEVRDKVLDTLGYHVVQTIVPQLIPLHLREEMVTLNSKRLREVPAKLGYEAAVTLNPWPHPFP
ncbi:MAG: YcaO-like family protein, partial [bacterium]|nr:YcaO-like family protein [bacterium]